MSVIQKTCLVRTASCYVGVLDKASPAWIPGLFEADLRRGMAEAKAAGLAECYGLFVLNSHLSERADRGELLAWTLLFDGIYKARFSVLPNSSPVGVPEREGLGAVEEVANLNLPSGHVVIACLSRTGDPSVEPVLQVEPGRYRVRFLRHRCEDDHVFLERESDYPPEEGPDWTITISPLPNEPSSSFGDR